MAPHDRDLPGGPDEPEAVSDPAAGRPDAAPTVDLDIDLTSHEMLRRAHVLDALGDDWDPVAALRDEETAHRLLYSGLDDEQRRIYDDLVAAGVLPGDGGGHAAA
ncbi:DUF6400 family protein [Streptomyces caniscabiei]|uniref:Uncharacterized protein n=1 Tax=Streptomyces caniscabiei TaxID=2746961 RepID=A0A927QGN2_9ACTN|nr:DUF6400 family protein [Streptomyces caniscabiei]MBD9726388.1 hypothetical protein [Streptomyces caniscabiei]MDX3511757.1 DUF6400 family protein [Streptomyces caniscabiei]MDX3719306.1 DUF6400 family protein [Streptomyces caniscabiei]MDX3726120.1 DUF6400 family protein [Streptomyces caniscabiei]WEO29555.1 DUF6400 family protein [Streptomyces caniscabiei]